MADEVHLSGEGALLDEDGRMPSVVKVNDIQIRGEIKTGSGVQNDPLFVGIEREGRVFTDFKSPTAIYNFGDGWPRLVMPDGITTDAYAIVEIEEWWLHSTIGVYFEWTNDHSATGNVRFELEMTECDIATQTLVDANTNGLICNVQRTASSPNPNCIMTTICGSIATGNPIIMTPGILASVYVLRITRLGADAADTLAGPIGLLAASMTRGQ